MPEMNGFSGISPEDKERLALTGIHTDSMEGRAGSFLLVNDHNLHAGSQTEGVEVLMIEKALEKYEWLKEYCWKIVPADKDQYTKYVSEHPQRGYVIIAHKGAKTTFPLQSCMFMQGDTIQTVHNIVIAEDGSEVHLIAGCASSLKTKEGAHYGINEIYVGKNAKVTSTMIHTWGEEIEVFPRAATIVEEGGTFLSNYVCMRPTKMVQMYPTAYLKGKGAVARFSSVIVAGTGSHIDAGSRAVLQAPNTSAELITRAITNGGTIISRGAIIAEVPQTKGHIECRGLILKDGVMHAIPEIDGRVVDIELSHEAAVGKIARDEIEYLMARGLSEEEATATIIRGFLDVRIEGLPDALQKQIENVIDSADHGFQMKVHDVSVGLHPGMYVYPGDPEFSLIRMKTGDAFISSLSHGTHTGTHIDAPAHYFENGIPVDKLALENLITSAEVVTPPLMPTRNCTAVLFKNAAPLSLETAKQLLLADIKTVCCDTPSIGDDDVHRFLLENGIIIIEMLDLSNILDGVYRMIALPLKIEGADASPARVVLVEDRV